MTWTLARRAERMNPSVIREILKVTEKPGIISFAGGLPSPKTFPVEAFAAACETVLRTDGRAALQYAASEGYRPLCEWIAAHLPWDVSADQVLITTGSQQGLDLVAKVLIDEGSTVLVETPTYLGALQAFTPMEPRIVSVDSDAEGVDIDDLVRKAAPTLRAGASSLPPRGTDSPWGGPAAKHDPHAPPLRVSLPPEGADSPWGGPAAKHDPHAPPLRGSLPPEGVDSPWGGPAANRASEGARFLYVLPNFQNPTGRSMSEARRAALVERAAAIGLPLVEDNPYGDLWFDQPPPQPLTARNPDGCIYLGSFSKVLAPGLRLGYVIAPKAIMPKLLQAKQAADLHSPSFNQRLVSEVLKDGFLDRHVPTIRALYKNQCHAMLEALGREFGTAGPPQGDESPLGGQRPAQRRSVGAGDVEWNSPDGGMFLWARLPEGMSAIDLLPQAVDKGVAFVPGAAFYATEADPRTLRLSFVTASVEQIHIGIAALAKAIREVRS